MNRPPESFVFVQEDRLLEFTTACFEKAGLTHDHAALISRLLVNSDLRGVRSHGTRTVNGYCGSFEDGSANINSDVSVLLTVKIQIQEPTTFSLFGSFEALNSKLP